MLADTIRCALTELAAWLWAGVVAAWNSPLPMSGVRGHLAALLHTPGAALAVSATSVVTVAGAVRSAWVEIYGRWYRS